MAIQRLAIFFLRSMVIGSIVAVLILLLVPELRHGSGIDIRNLFNAEPTPKRASYYDAISRSAPSVVNIYSVSIESNGFLSNSSRERTNLGSGVIMTNDGYILTCHHVINGAASIFIATPSGIWGWQNRSAMRRNLVCLQMGKRGSDLHSGQLSLLQRARDSSLTSPAAMSSIITEASASGAAKSISLIARNIMIDTKAARLFPSTKG